MILPTRNAQQAVKLGISKRVAISCKCFLRTEELTEELLRLKELLATKKTQEQEMHTKQLSFLLVD